MELKTYLTLVFLFSAVQSNQCCENLNELFNSDSSMCHGYGWSFSATPSSIDKHSDITHTLTPGRNTTCITSKILSLTREGYLEVKVYSKAITKEDFLTISVYDAYESIVGQTSFYIGENRFNDGWSVFKVMLTGVGSYEGFIMLTGKSSADSNIVIGSICYSSPQESKPSEDILKLTTHYETPDIYTLQTGSLLVYPVHRKENDPNRYEEDIGNRSFWIFDTEDFWTPLTISLAVIIPVIILALLSWACFALGKKRGAKQDPQIIYEDLDNIPKPYLVPRVKNFYAETVSGSGYAGTSNNIYSV